MADISVTTRDEATEIAVGGELDAKAAVVISARAEKAVNKGAILILIDVSAVNGVRSEALTSLLALRSSLLRRKSDLQIINASRELTAVFRLLKVEGLLQLKKAG